MDKEKRERVTYRPFRSGQDYYIDKTGVLETVTEAFPSVYIEGAAASGKTTLVRMFLDKHPEMETAVFRMNGEQQNPREFNLKTEKVLHRMEENPVCAVFEDLPKELSAEAARQLVWLVRHLPEGSRVIMTGREMLPEGLLDLLWKQQMKLIPQKYLCFSREEISAFAAHMKSGMDSQEIYEVTGGWAGCVALMLQLSAESGAGAVNARELRKRYEVDTYIRKQILDTLSEAEREIVRRGRSCPWMNEALCLEVFGDSQAAEVMDSLCRKGIMVYHERVHYRKLAPLFSDVSQREQPDEDSGFLKRLGIWYGSRGYLPEMFRCLKQLNDKEARETALKKYYDRIPFLGGACDPMTDVAEYISIEERTPESCYLRGMYFRKHHNLSGLNREIANLEEILRTAAERDRKTVEIYLNLCYANPELPLDEWLELAEKWLGNGCPHGGLRLYGLQGRSFSCLDGIRDITGLFACSGKEERRKEKLWTTYLGSSERTMYRLARIEYYLETERKDALPEEDKELLNGIAQAADDERFAAGFRLSAMYLLCRLQRISPDAETERRIENLEAVLSDDESVCRADALALGSLYALCRKEPGKFIAWLTSDGSAADTAVTEENFNIMFCRAKGYLFLNQHEKSRKILQMLIPYLQSRRHNRFLAEVLFEQAIIHWNTGNRGGALRSMIESFSVSGGSRYVASYAEYGARGNDVLEFYADWARSNLPEGLSRKKKYSYGSVLRMSEGDYLNVLLRCTKRETRSTPGIPEPQQGERLTMMETVILQHISRGLNNAEICDELNLKLPTVKSHIYSLYQKLGVNRRVQAIIRAKEMGIVD